MPILDHPIAEKEWVGSVNFEWHDPDGTVTEVEIDRPLHAEVMILEAGKPARFGLFQPNNSGLDSGSAPTTG